MLPSPPIARFPVAQIIHHINILSNPSPTQTVFLSKPPTIYQNCLTLASFKERVNNNLIVEAG